MKGERMKTLPGLMLLLAPCALIATESGRNDDVEAVRAIGVKWKTYYMDGDFGSIPDLYTVDTVVMPRGRPRIEGREHLRRSMGGLAAGRRVTIDVKEREIVIAGDVAWFIGDFTVTYVPKDERSAPITEFGRSLIIFKRGSDGTWRVHRDIDSPAPSPQGVDRDDDAEERVRS